MSILSGYLCEIFYCYGLWKEGLFARPRSNDTKDFFSFLLLRKILIQFYFIEYRRATSAIWSKVYLSNLTNVDNNWLSFNSLSDFVLFYFVLIFIPYVITMRSKPLLCKYFKWSHRFWRGTLIADPHETNNLARENPKIVAKMAAQINLWKPLKKAKAITSWD